MTAQDIKGISDTQIVNIQSGKCGTVSVTQKQVMKYEDRFTGKRSIVVILREGITRYYGCALTAYFEGKKGIHYVEFYTASAAANFINKN